MIIECYEWKIWGDYNEEAIGFSRNQLSLSKRNSETDLKKKPWLKQKQKSPQVMPPVAKNKKIDSNTKIENAVVSKKWNCIQLNWCRLLTKHGWIWVNL